MLIETRYKLGDEVWFGYHDTVPQKGIVAAIHYNLRLQQDACVEYEIDGLLDKSLKVVEQRLFKSLDDYIEHLNQRHAAMIDAIQKKVGIVQAEGEK